MLRGMKKLWGRTEINSTQFSGLNRPMGHVQTGSTSFTFNLGGAIRLQTTADWTPGVGRILKNDCFAH